MFIVQNAGTFPWISALQKYLWLTDAEVLLKPPDMERDFSQGCVVVGQGGMAVN